MLGHAYFPQFWQSYKYFHIYSTYGTVLWCTCGTYEFVLYQYIHCDLAARNVVLAEDNVVKICDFGLAKVNF